MSTTPIACTLTASEQEARLATLSALRDRALRSRTPIDGGVRLTFAPGDDVERELRAAVAAEAECCSFLDMVLTRAGGELVLEVTGPQEARPIIAELFA